jgi:periplasmic protein TonB
MDSKTILKSNILDILFENRNKAYGAYVLRKDYNSHVVKSLLIMFAIVAAFSIWQVLSKNTNVLITLPDIPGVVVQNNPVEPPKPEHKQPLAQSPDRNKGDHPPVISKDSLVTKDTTSHSDHSLTIGKPGDTPVIGDTVATGPVKPIEPVKPIAPVKPVEPLNVAEVMPEYPGGINALVKFLKNNLHSPRDLEENEESNVQVKFVVKVDGSLSGFEVLRSGGNDFDREVLRVLGKMPKWIPGRTNGENVSVFYTVPVKFTPNSN